ncbi:MAG: rhomboid family intramembrane serine protease [Betaproteobacteria bacterium]|nr:rhomboid family intramembrane serine protease [Betaproteobacteria bacterium]
MVRPTLPSALIALIAIAVIALAFAPEGLQRGLEFDRAAILHGELWRLWTAHLVHYSRQHAATDIVMLLVAGTCAEKLAGAGRVVQAFLWIAPVIALALLFVSTDLVGYRGLSAVVSYLFMLAWIAAWGHWPSARPVLALAAAAMAGKMAADAFGFSADLAGLPDGVRVEWRAHLLGITAATLASISGDGDLPDPMRRLF